ncbi:hypothetical protein J537_1410 [Acinetobacter baumannii 1437282]|nr:hypothetical protein J537_1410 [Acinetobacter baumannii 1437282]
MKNRLHLEQSFSFSSRYFSPESAGHFYKSKFKRIQEHDY